MPNPAKRGTIYVFSKIRVLLFLKIRHFFRIRNPFAGMRSLNGEYVIAVNSSHYIQIDQPELVTGSIRSVVNASRDDFPSLI